MPPPSPVKSPAKDLSKVFEMFSATAAGAGPSVGKGKPQGRTGSGIIAGMGGRTSVERKGSDHLFPSTPGRTLHRSHSQPIEPSPPVHDSSRALASSSFLPSFLPASPPRPTTPLKPSRPLARSNTSLALIDSTTTRGTRKTYGGARSFKRDVEEERLFAALPEDRGGGGKSSPSAVRKSLLPTLPSRPRETYVALRKKYGADEEDELMEEGAEGASQVRSITQMRAKGENASAIEVLRKVSDPEFVRRLKSLGLVERVYVEFRKAEAGEGDRALDPALALLVATFAHDQRLTEPLLRLTTNEFSKEELAEDAIFDAPTCDVLVILAAMLGRSWAGELVGSAAVGKGVTKSDVRAPTLRSICLVAISEIACFAPRTVFRPQQLVCSSGALDAVVLSLINEAKGLPLRMSRFESGLDLLPADGSISVPQMDTCLRIIEACSSSDISTHDILWAHMAPLTLSLADIVLSCHILAAGSSPDPKVASSAMDVLLSALRLLIELTTRDPAWSLALSNCERAVPTLVKLLVAARTKEQQPPPAATKEKGKRIRALSRSSATRMETDGEGELEDLEEDEPEAALQIKFDVLCLALGVLTNLVETVPEVKDVLRETEIDATCAEHRMCARACHCPGRSSAIHRLTALFLDPLEDSTHEITTNFVNDYLSILVGLVMLDAPLNQALVVAALVDEPRAMAKLLSDMEDFAKLHDEAERQEQVELDVGVQSQESETAGEREEGTTATSGLAVRIRRMVVALREGEA